MPKLFCFFSGTGCTATQTRDEIFPEVSRTPDFKPDTVRIFFNGCQDSRIGGRLLGGSLAPDLDVAASKLRRCFNDDKTLSLRKLKAHFGSAIVIEGAETLSDDAITVDEIDLLGFSRGAVTTFAAARALDELDLPMHLCAIEPVPGNSKDYAKNTSSEFHKNHDLRGCRNLKSAEVILGAYSKEESSFHNKYLRQMVPLFAATCDQSVKMTAASGHFSDNPLRVASIFDFVIKRGLSEPAEHPYTRPFTTACPPKIIQQKFHLGLSPERVTYHPLIKEKLLEYAAEAELCITNPTGYVEGVSLIDEDHVLPFITKRMGELREHSFKKIHALACLYQLVSDYRYRDDIDPLNAPVLRRIHNKLMMEDSSNEAKAFREFVVEFHAVLRHITQDRSMGSVSGLVDFFQNTLDTIASKKLSELSLEQKDVLKKQIIQQLDIVLNKSENKALFPEKKAAEIRGLMNLFLEEQVIFNTSLARFIDETETGVVTTRKTTDSDVDFKPIALLSLEELSKRLYLMSHRSRVAATTEVLAVIPKLVHDSNQLGEILRFLPPSSYKSVLTANPRLVTSNEDVVLITDKLFTAEQRAVFNDQVITLRPGIPSASPHSDLKAKMHSLRGGDTSEGTLTPSPTV